MALSLKDPLIANISGNAATASSVPWTGVTGRPNPQNVLTSTSTTDYLTANQGKVLADTKVAKAGDTMTGNLTLSGSPRAIKFSSGTRTGSPITFYNGTVDGSGIVIGDGGRTIIGGGESAGALRTALGGNDSDESMHIASDGNVYIHTNCQTIGSRKTITINTAANISAPGGFTGNLSGEASTAGTAYYANVVKGTYSGNGGQQPPNWMGRGNVRFCMMNGAKGVKNFPTYADCILMDTYNGGDVAWATGLCVTRSSPVKGYLISGSDTNASAWSSCVEILTENNYKTYCTPANIGALAAANPTGTGSLSLNRKAGSTIGANSVAVGNGCTASGSYSFAEGSNTTASGGYSHAEGLNSIASYNYAHVENYNCTASGLASHAEGQSTTASGTSAHAEGEGTKASGANAHAEGAYTLASGRNQHVEGKYNINDTNGGYAHIIGGGTSDTDRKNIFTVDWSGNVVAAGDVFTSAGASLNAVNNRKIRAVAYICYNIGTTINLGISSPTGFVCIVIPYFFTTNSLSYNVTLTTMAANSSSFCLEIFPKNDGNYVQSGTVDIEVICLPM